MVNYSNATTDFFPNDHLYRYLAPFVAIALFVLLGVYSLSLYSKLPTGIILLILIGSILIFSPAFSLAYQIKTVSIDGGALYVESRSDEIRIPFDRISKVHHSPWPKHQTVTIEFKANIWPDKIIFVPSVLSKFTAVGHPIVEELNALARNR